jgi:hypothetical protein
MDYFHPTLGLMTASQGFTLDGVQYPADWLRRADAASRAALGFLDVHTEAKPDDKFHWVTQADPVVRDGVAVVGYTAFPKDVVMVKAMRLADLAAKRYEVETGGTIVNDMPVETDRDTQSKLSGALVAIASGLPCPLRWKGPEGFVTLDETTLKAIALAVATHVQEAFAAEADHHEALSALTDFASTVAYDFTTGWPANPVKE